MKKDIHPAYYPKATVTCACGSSFTVGSTQEKLEVEICAACHPFYTGEEKVIDTAGRVEKFKARREEAQNVAKTRTGKKKKEEKRRAAKKKKEEKKKKPAAKKAKGER